MIIKEIGMISFGKFQDQIINLQQGITLIWGENESGKTTLHRLIEGVLFGFYKPYLKNKKFDEEQERYKPKANDNQYKAYLIYEHLGVNYRFERNFKQETIQLLNMDSGEDITNQFEYDDVQKQYIPAFSQFGMNRMAYRNTVAIEQMKVLTDAELVKELMDKLLSISDSNTESISVDEILKKIDEQRNDIGSIKKKTSEYYKITERIYQLKDEKETAIALETKAIDVQDSYIQLKTGYEKAIHDLSVLKMKKEKIEATANLNILNQYESITAQIEEKEKNYQGRDAFKHVQVEELDRLMVLKQEYQILVQQVEPLKTIIQSEQEALERIATDFQYDNSDDSPEDVETNYRLVRRLQEDIRGLELVINKETSDQVVTPAKIEVKIKLIEDIDAALIIAENDLSHIDLPTKNIELKKAKGAFRVVSILTIVFALCMAGSAFLFIFMDLVRYGIMAGFGILVVTMVVVGRSKSKKVKEAAKSCDFAIKKQADLESDIATKLTHKEGIMKTFGITTISDLRMLYVKAMAKETSTQDYQMRRNNLIAERDDLMIGLKRLALKFTGSETVTQETIAELKNKYKTYLESKGLVDEKQNKIAQSQEQLSQLEIKLQSIEESIQVIKTDNDLQDEDIKVLKEQKHLYDTEFKEVEALKDSLRNLLYQKNIEDIRKAREILERTTQVYVQMEDKEFIFTRYEETQEKINQLSKQLGQIESDLIKAETAYRPIQEIEEEIARLDEKLQEFDKKLRKYDLMTRALIEAREDVQKNFAPEINKRISQIISIITDGKYTDLMMTQDMKMMIIDRRTKEAINVETLSSGTLDQIYFALRLAISDVMDEQGHLPLLLDESFAQFDDLRFNRALNVLNQTGRQVLYFTCKQNEVDIIRTKIPEVAVIKL